MNGEINHTIIDNSSEKYQNGGNLDIYVWIQRGDRGSGPPGKLQKYMFS